MTRTEMHGWFDLVQDKYNAPYFIAEEKDNFLNRAQIAFVNEIFPPSEATIYSEEYIQTLIIEDLSVSTETSFYYPNYNIITEGAIEAALQARTGAVDTKMHIYSVVTDGSIFTAGKPVRFVRHNDFAKIKGNVFKSPKNDDPVYRIVKEGIVVNGETTLTAPENFLVTIIKYPLTISETKDCDLPNMAHEIIVAIALEFAGIATRDEVLTIMKQKVTQ